MVKIRLRRMGRKHEPHYRIVAANVTSPRDGRFIEELGWYSPKAKDQTYSLKTDLIKKWLSNGAQPSDTVRNILVKEGLLPKLDLVHTNKPKALKNPDKRRKNRKKEPVVAAASEEYSSDA